MCQPGEMEAAPDQLPYFLFPHIDLPSDSLTDKLPRPTFPQGLLEMNFDDPEWAQLEGEGMWDLMCRGQLLLKASVQETFTFLFAARYSEQ